MIFLFLSLFSFYSAAEIRDTAGKGNYICVAPVEKIGHGYRPNCVAEGLYAGRKYSIQINSAGLRDKDYSEFPAKNVFRILVTGSSSLAAPGLEESAGSVRVTEKKLRAMGYQVEIINGATEGYLTAANAIRLPQLLAKYHPNLVVHYLISSGDPIEDATAFANLSFDDKGIPLQFNSFPMPPKLELFPESIREIIWNLVTSWKSNSFRLATAKESYQKYKENKLSEIPVISREIDLLRAMAKTVTAKNAKFLLLSSGESIDLGTSQIVGPGQVQFIAQYFHMLAPKVLLPYQVLADELQKTEIETAILANGVGKPGLTFPGDYHLNEKGAELFADSFAKILEKKIPNNNKK